MKNRFKKIIRALIPESRIYSAMSLYPGKTREEIVGVLEKSAMRNLWVCVIGILAFGVITFGLYMNGLNSDETAFVSRGKVNGENVTIPILFSTESWEEIATIEVNPLEMTDEEIDSMEQELEQLLDVFILGENGNFDCIRQDMVLPETVEGFPVKIVWSTSDYRILEPSGKVKNTDDKEYGTVIISGKVMYGKDFRLYEKTVTVMPKLYTGKEAELRMGLKEVQKLEAESRNEMTFVLPKEVNGITVTSPQKKDRTWMLTGILGVIAVPLFVRVRSNEKIREKKKRRMELSISEYKDFVAKLTVLVAAGLSLRTAWMRLGEEYGKKEKDSMLSDNLKVSLSEFHNGYPETEVYENFGERMENIMWQRLMTVMIQAATKGVTGVTEVLSAELKEVMAAERDGIRAKGEQAGTGLLVPMVGYLIIVFAILLVPAFTSF